MAVSSLSILPEHTIIDLYKDTPAAVPLIVKGQVQLQLTRPIHVRQITVIFRGQVRSEISNDYTQIVAGLSTASQTIVREEQLLLNERTIVTGGLTRWPFEISIRGAHQLPPSVDLSRHTILYEVSARLSLSSLTERLKLNWNERINSLGLSRSSLDPDPVTHSMDNNVNSDWLSVALPPRKQKRALMRVSRSIQVLNHSYASLDVARRSRPRIRYRGKRQGHIQYEICMPSFVCLEESQFDIMCHLQPLRDEGRVAKIVMYIEQVETYPIRPGVIKFGSVLPKELLAPRTTKSCYKEYDVREEDNLAHLPLSLPLDTARLAPNFAIGTLDVKHHLRLLLFFIDNMKARRMSLSFPLEMGTVPGSRHMPSPPHWREDDTIVEAWEERLPSYYDALHEGPPPSFTSHHNPIHPSLSTVYTHQLMT